MKKISFMSVILVFLLSGCHQFGGGVRVSNEQHQVQTLPPAHAPAYGRRAQYRYYYYPDARFYFDIGRNLYFYLDSRGNWSVSARFPAHLQQYRHSHYVEIEMDSDKPYQRYNDHRRKYPPGQLKKKHKKDKKSKNKKYDDDDRPGKRPYYDY